MVYANPVSTDLVSGRHYDRRAESYYLSRDKLEGDFAPARFEREIRLFRRHCQAGRVLDVGCSTGGFLCQLKRRFPGAYTVAGCDVTEAALNYAEQHGIEVFRGPFLELPLGEREFDAVTFWAVLEHVAHPKAFLAKAASLLRPGGVCWVLVPNRRSLAIRLLGARYRYVTPEHLNYFDPSTLRRLVETDPRIEWVSLASTHFNPVVIWEDARRRRDAVPAAERARLLRRTTSWKQSPLLFPARLLYRAAEACLSLWNLADNLAAALRRR
jgi:2-polyprenyl-3-methyl-5-hydroxy-6-metoxy-1,4-benzoquinol methylase